MFTVDLKAINYMRDAMAKASEKKIGSVIGFFMLGADPKKNNPKSTLHYCIVDFGNLNVQLAKSELSVLLKALDLALSGKSVPDHLFDSPANSWHTIKSSSGDDEQISFRYASISWSLDKKTADSIRSDIFALMKDNHYRTSHAHD